MKKIFLAALFAATLLPLAAQQQKQKVNTSEVRITSQSKAEDYAEIEFDTLRHNFGSFSKAAPTVKCTFPFVNTGTAPLIIHQAFASCGCTVPTFTKKPIKPGEKGTIEVTYHGKGRLPGHFQKTITVRCNARTEIVRLSIEGTME